MPVLREITNFFGGYLTGFALRESHPHNKLAGFIVGQFCLFLVNQDTF